MMDKIISTWKSPNVYGHNYSELPSLPGVYVIISIVCDGNGGFKNKIQYIGGSKDLSKRLKNHNVLKHLLDTYWYARIFFIECRDYKKLERDLIKLILPKYNSHRYFSPRGGTSKKITHRGAN